MNNFCDKLKTDHVELTKKLSDLKDFIGSEPFSELIPIQQNLLIMQYNTMYTYQIILNQRLELLK